MFPSPAVGPNFFGALRPFFKKVSLYSRYGSVATSSRSHNSHVTLAFHFSLGRLSPRQTNSSSRAIRSFFSIESILLLFRWQLEQQPAVGGENAPCVEPLLFSRYLFLTAEEERTRSWLAGSIHLSKESAAAQKLHVLLSPHSAPPNVRTLGQLSFAVDPLAGHKPSSHSAVVCSSVKHIVGREGNCESERLFLEMSRRRAFFPLY